MTNSKSKIKKKNNKIVCATVFPNHFLIKKNCVSYLHITYQFVIH